MLSISEIAAVAALFEGKIAAIIENVREGLQDKRPKGKSEREPQH